MSSQYPNVWIRAHLAFPDPSGDARVLISGSPDRINDEVSVPWEVFRELYHAYWDWPFFLRVSNWIGLSELREALFPAVSQVVQAWREVAPSGESLPLYASSDLPDFSFLWAQIVRQELAFLHDLPFEVEVLTAPDRFVETPPSLQLPIRITGAGGQIVREALEALEQNTWYLQRSEVRDFALRVENRTYEGWRFWGPDSLGDIVVSDLQGLDSLIEGMRILEAYPTLPRLIIVLGRQEPPYWMRSDRFPSGVAVAFIPDRGLGSGAEEDLRWFIEEIVHDLPLHEAMRIFRRNRFYRETERADRREPDGWRLPFLWATPATNQSLRLSTVLPQIVGEASRLQSFSEAADLGQFCEKLKDFVGEQRARRLEELLAPVQEASDSYRSARVRRISFDRESHGLVPMAELAAAAAKLSASHARVAEGLEALIREPSMAEALEQLQERRVDAELSYLWRDGSVHRLSGEERLQPEALLRLLIHIGLRADGSLVIGDPPPLDPLLPPLRDDQSHFLDIVVFPKDFRLESAATQRVELSRFGGTVPVDFDLLSPRLLQEPPDASVETDGFAVDISKGRGWVANGPAELRFSIFHKNQLLQSFRLKAMLGDGPALDDEGRRITVECDFSQTRRFGSLSQLGGRAISLGLNRDENASHTLTLVRSGEEPVSISWTEGQMARYTDAIRHALQEVTALHQSATPFPFDAATLRLKTSPPPAFAAAIAKLAHAGSGLYTQLFLKNAGAQHLLAELRAGAGEVVQIARHDADYAFPWPLLYDFAPPRGGSAGPVCLGQDSEGNSCRCEANRNPSGWCLRGFWGFRHVVEQLCEGPKPLDDVPGKIAGTATSPALGVIPAVQDHFVAGWLNTLAPPPLAPHLGHPLKDEFLGWLRDAPSRPHLVIFIGHHVDNRPGGPPDPQLLMGNDTVVLRLYDFVNEPTPREWEEPRSLVFLLACGSGTQRVDTGTSLAAALLGLGAVGVLATECAVRTCVVSRMARDLTLRLEAGEKMGPAMRETILELAAEGCPLGLAFTYLGSADAQLPQ